MKKHVYIVLLAFGALMAAACGRSEIHINVNDDELVGLWQKENSQEYWRYNEDYSGVTWDEAEDITEEESNLVYTWSVTDGDVLRHVFTGAEANQAVPKVYTVKEISSVAMTWEDDYGMRYRLVKVKD